MQMRLIPSENTILMRNCNWIISYSSSSNSLGRETTQNQLLAITLESLRVTIITPMIANHLVNLAKRNKAVERRRRTRTLRATLVMKLRKDSDFDLI